MATISNTVNGGLLQAPKTQANKPINWGAISLTPAKTTTSVVTPKVSTSITPATTQTNVASSPQNNFTTPSGATVNATSGKLVNPPPQQTTFTQPSRGLFGSVAQSLANTSLQGSPQLQAITGMLQSTSNQLNPAYTENLARYNDLSKQIADVAQRGERAQAGYRTTGTTPVAEGNAAVIAQTQAAQQAALGAQQQAALTAAGLGQSQQQLQQQGLTNAGELAQQALGLTQSGLTSAAGLAPEATRFEAFGGTSLDPQNRAQNVANQIRQGLISPQDGEAMMTSLYGGAGATFLNQALQSSGYNYIQGGAQAAGQAATLAQLPALESANVAAEGVKNKINAFLSSNPDLNQNTLAAANLAQQWLLGKQFTDPKYQTLFNYLNEYTNTLAPILGVGGNVTNLKTEIAQGFINAAASGQSISQVLDSMSRLSTGKIQDIKSGAIGGGVVSSSGVNQITTQAADGNSYSFYQDANGQWHAR